MDVAPPCSQLLLEEERQVDLAHEADALRILALGGGEPLLGGDAPHLGLEQPAHGEERRAQLLLRELAEEVALVLARVAARKQPPRRAAVRPQLLRLAAVVARGDVVGPQAEGLLHEDVELDFAVAEHVGIGRASPFVLREHVVDHAAAVLG